MTELLWQGLTISLIGMGLTFAALGLLILAMILLERFAPNQPKRSDKERSEPAETLAVNSLAQRSEEEEIAAAIAVALAHMRSLDICQSGLGSTLEAGPGAWWQRGQARQQAGTVLKQRQNGKADYEFNA